MNPMNMPGFTADRSLCTARGGYRSGRPSVSPQGAVIPAIPNCRNCDYILDNCVRNHGRPTALCNACAVGDCYDDPPMPNPYPTSIDWPPEF